MTQKLNLKIYVHGKVHCTVAEPSEAKVQIDWIRENQFICWKNDCYNFLKNLIL